VISLFVYGTLRQGGPLQHLLPTGLERRTAVMWDASLFEYAGGAYPVLMLTPGVRTPVVGDLLSLDVDNDERHAEAFVDIVRMEQFSGYGVSAHVVRTVDDSEQHTALVFVYGNADDDAIGPYVESGDWITHTTLDRARAAAAAAGVHVEHAQPGPEKFDDDWEGE